MDSRGSGSGYNVNDRFDNEERDKFDNRETDKIDNGEIDKTDNREIDNIDSHNGEIDNRILPSNLTPKPEEVEEDDEDCALDNQHSDGPDLFVCGLCDFTTSHIHPFLDHFKIHDMCIGLDKPTHTCCSLEDESGRSIKQESFKCYVCSCLFTSMCRLQDHLVNCMTMSDGSFIFDNNKRTAFPFTGQATDGDKISGNTNHYDSILETINTVIKKERESISSDETYDGDELDSTYESEMLQKISKMTPELFNEGTAGKKTVKKRKRKIKTNDESASESKKKDLKCHVCSKTFSQPCKLEYHLKTHSEERPFPCTQCNKTYKHQFQLNRHIANAHPFNDIRCRVCDKMFRSLSKLTNHLKTHSKDGVPVPKVFACDQCDQSFDSYGELRKHSETHPAVAHVCDICGKSYASYLKLKRHEKLHTLSQRHTCETCGKSFKRKGHLYRHKNVHLDVMPYVCEICARGFSDTSRLKVHMMKHNEEENRTFKCTMCAAKFYTDNQLQRHMHVHTGIKTAICDLCGRGFSRPEFLRAHMSGVHKQEKRFHCLECDRKFLTNYQLKCHAMTHTGVRPYWCRYCGAKFIQRKELRKHMKNSHGLDLDDQPKASQPATNSYPQASYTMVESDVATDVATILATHGQYGMPPFQGPPKY